MKARFGGKGCVCGKKAMYVRRGIHGAEIYGDIQFLKTETACNEFCRASPSPPTLSCTYGKEYAEKNTTIPFWEIVHVCT